MKSKSEQKTQWIESYTIHKDANRSASTVEVKVTSGKLEGKSARVITTRPSAAYFNSPSLEKVRA